MAAIVLASNRYNAPIQGDDKPSYHVEIFESQDPQQLEDDINAALATIDALPANAIALLDIQYTSARYANNKVSYSACISYVTFGAE